MSTCMSGTHMVCTYGKMLTSILRIDFYMTSRPACDWVYISLIPVQALGYKAISTFVVYEYLYTDEFIRWRSGFLCTL